MRSNAMGSYDPSIEPMSSIRLRSLEDAAHVKRSRRTPCCAAASWRLSPSTWRCCGGFCDVSEPPEAISATRVLVLMLVVIGVPLLPLLVSGEWRWAAAWSYAIVGIVGFIVSRLLAARPLN